MLQLSLKRGREKRKKGSNQADEWYCVRLDFLFFLLHCLQPGDEPTKVKGNLRNPLKTNHVTLPCCSCWNMALSARAWPRMRPPSSKSINGCRLVPSTEPGGSAVISVSGFYHTGCASLWQLCHIITCWLLSASAAEASGSLPCALDAFRWEDVLCPPSLRLPFCRDKRSKLGTFNGWNILGVIQSR